MQFSVLGEVCGWRGETPLELGPPQRRAVLAALLLRAGKSVTAAELVEGIWGEDPVPRAIAALRTHVAQLRRVLEPDRISRAPSTVLVSVGDGYALRIPPGSTDVEEVEALVSTAERVRGETPDAAREALIDALARWRGPALSGLAGPFAERHRTRLEQWRLAILEDRLALDIEVGRAADAVAELGPLIDEHPLRERFRALLMAALYHCGRQAEALEVFARARRDLVDGIGVEPGPELTAMHERILRAEMPTPRPNGYGPEPVVPAQLPPDIADFTGREQLVEHIAEQLTGGGSAVAISAVGGMGGVGKTTLALHVAHHVRNRFPDGQLYVNLRGVDPVPTSPGDALGGFLRALGIAEGQIPGTVDDRAAELRTRLSGKRMLIVLDNARGSAQLTPLLAGTPGTAVLITSRSALTEMPAVRRTRLDVLERDEAMALLIRILGPERVAAEESAARQVVALCGCLPLAVRIVGARLAVRPQWTIGSFAARLADEKGRLAVLETGELGVEAAFRLGYGQLNEQQAKAFRTLALVDFPDLPVDGVAAVLGIAESEAERICESLVDLSLLETTVPGRYRFHDLLRLFAQSIADEDESAVLVRLLDYYLAGAKNLLSAIDYSNTTRLLIPTTVPGRRFASGAEGQVWNDVERPVVIALHRQAARVGGRALQAAADLAWVMAELMDAGTRARELSEALTALLDTAIRESHASERRIRVALGALLQVGLGEVAASLKYLDAAAGPPRTTPIAGSRCSRRSCSALPIDDSAMSKHRVGISRMRCASPVNSVTGRCRPGVWPWSPEPIARQGDTTRRSISRTGPSRWRRRHRIRSHSVGPPTNWRPRYRCATSTSAHSNSAAMPCGSRSAMVCDSGRAGHEPDWRRSSCAPAMWRMRKTKPQRQSGCSPRPPIRSIERVPWLCMRARWPHRDAPVRPRRSSVRPPRSSGARGWRRPPSTGCSVPRRPLTSRIRRRLFNVYRALMVAWNSLGRCDRRSGCHRADALYTDLCARGTQGVSTCPTAVF